MSQQISSPHAELHRRVNEILHYIWDPIDVSGIPEARDEYDSYVSSVISRVVNHSPYGSIANYLIMIEGENMGLTVTPESRECAIEVEDMIRNHKEVIWQRAGITEPNKEAESGRREVLTPAPHTTGHTDP